MKLELLFMILWKLITGSKTELHYTITNIHNEMIYIKMHTCPFLKYPNACMEIWKNGKELLSLRRFNSRNKMDSVHLKPFESFSFKINLAEFVDLHPGNYYSFRVRTEHRNNLSEDYLKLAVVPSILSTSYDDKEVSKDQICLRNETCITQGLRAYVEHSNWYNFTVPLDDDL